MRRSLCGSSKISRIVWMPGSAARQPPFSRCNSADSIGNALSSDATSTDAMLSKSIHPRSGGGDCGGRVMIRLRIFEPNFLQISRSKSSMVRRVWPSCFPQEAGKIRGELVPDVPDSECTPQAAKSILVIGGGSCFSSILPLVLIFASSQLSSAPTSMAKPVQ